MLDKFGQVTERFGSLKYMREPQARFLRDFITENDCKDVLEIGFYQGKSSAYMAAILEDLGRGHLTCIDKTIARKRSPNIEAVLTDLALSHRVTPLYAERSYTWELGKMIERDPTPRFDLCYFDGGHIWDSTGFGFALVHLLLRPGGWIIFDDMDWTIAGSLQRGSTSEETWKGYSEEEKTAPAVRMVFDTLVPGFGYTNLQVVKRFKWGIAQKPSDAPMTKPSAMKRLRHLLPV